MSLVQSKSSRVDKRSASTFLRWHGGCAALIHPTFFAENKFTLGLGKCGFICACILAKIEPCRAHAACSRYETSVLCLSKLNPEVLGFACHSRPTFTRTFCIPGSTLRGYFLGVKLCSCAVFLHFPCLPPVPPSWRILSISTCATAAPNCSTAPRWVATLSENPRYTWASCTPIKTVRSAIWG